MADLPLLATPYPGANPAYQLSTLLAPGIVPLGGVASCWALVTENLLTVSIRVNPSGATQEDGNVFLGLPPDLRPIVNTPDTAQQQLFLMADGRIWYRTTAGRLQDKTELNATFIAARRPA